ncbi:MAG: peptide-methionine (S)-S-oxide reductase MsrA [Bacteroidales bacterium]|nr:peptide-methionine (S)-S-oxide reductase MsrA [Bacteroidales bacterium]
MATAYFSAGCFWGVEYYFKRLRGILFTQVGFMGGSLDNPSYKEVKTGLTGHLETIRVEYDPEVVSYEALVKYFFEIHDFEQADGQGIDIGTQYLSAIWFQNAEERDTALKVFGDLIKMGYNPATQIRETMTFYPAEDYHQDYLDQRQESPECHVYRKVF